MLGLKPKDKLVMYCDTKAEWMVTALGCFKFNYTMVTIYTNLGEDGVTYGIHQTQSNYVCTSQELLPKLIKVLDKVRIFFTIIIMLVHSGQKCLTPLLILVHKWPYQG